MGAPHDPLCVEDILMSHAVRGGWGWEDPNGGDWGVWSTLYCPFVSTASCSLTPHQRLPRGFASMITAVLLRQAAVIYESLNFILASAENEA